MAIQIDTLDRPIKVEVRSAIPVTLSGHFGTQGPPGNNGTNGAQGPQGPAGVSGAVGPQGPQGVPGPTGATGAAGTPGSAGLTGAQGPQGVAGPTGARGPVGQQSVYIQPTNPNLVDEEYIWIQTGLPDNGFTFWFEDGQ